MSRRCVVCGKYATDNPCESYHYPRNQKEALIWQRSMGAFDTCVEAIQRECSVCIKHIPEFVELAQKQAALMTAKQPSTEQMNRPSLNVLLLPGATLPAYCGKSEQTKPEEQTETEHHEDKLDEDIIVKEFNVDCGTKFPDVDETEVTVLRTPLQNENGDQKTKEQHNGDSEQCGDSGNMTDCTDVLLLSRSQNCSAEVTSQGDLSAKCQCPSTKSNPSCAEFNYVLEQPLAGCECERKVRREMGEIIKKQQDRIVELEFQLCRQSDWHYSMQKKLDELYFEFGRLEPPNEEVCCCSRHTIPAEPQDEPLFWPQSVQASGSSDEDINSQPPSKANKRLS